MDRFRSYKARDEREFFEERKEEEIVVACSNASSFIVPPLLLFLWIVRYHAAWTMGNHRRNLFFHSNGILMELDVPRCLFIFFFFVSLIIICCSILLRIRIYIYIYSKLKFMETFFFLLYHKRTRLRSIEERFLYGHGGRKRKKIAMEGKVLVLLPAEAFFFLFFSETGDAFISGGVPERDRGDAKTTAADVNSWHAPFCSTVVLTVFFFFSREGNFIYIYID